MNKAELIAKIADDAGITKTQANASLDSFVAAVTTNSGGSGCISARDRRYRCCLGGNMRFNVTGRLPRPGEEGSVTASEAGGCIMFTCSPNSSSCCKGSPPWWWLTSLKSDERLVSEYQNVVMHCIETTVFLCAIRLLQDDSMRASDKGALITWLSL